MEKELRWEKQWIPEHLSAVGNEPWDTVWDRLPDGFRPETVPAGTVFYQQGDPAREVIFLQTGQIRVECIHSSGKKRVLCLLFEGIPVGEDECLFGGPREYRAVAATACQIFRIPAEVFKRRAEASPALALKLFQISARKSQVLGRMLIRDSFLSVRGRVIQFLLSVSEPYGTPEGGGPPHYPADPPGGGRFSGHLPGGGVPVLSKPEPGGPAEKDAPALSAPRPCRPGGPAPYIIWLRPQANRLRPEPCCRLCPPRSIYANSPVER